MDIRTIKDKALNFMQTLDAKKEALAPRDFTWYPYGTLNNFVHLDALLTGRNRLLLELIGKRATLDIGCADGDLAFFLESLGCKVQVVDFAPRGVRLLKDALSSSVEIHELDLDAQFALPEKAYGLVFFLGILYHLKNPFYIMESLAKACNYCLVSTRIAKFNTVLANSDQRTNISRMPVAYLLDELEANNDSTNYWIFSDAGLRRLLKRTGWDICDYMTVGNTVDSDPFSAEGDERVFCLVKSRLAKLP